jgi:hypothetical protein
MERSIWIARVLARLLDTSIRVPGTSIRIGLDPLIGLIPGVGDAIAGLAGSLILLLATQFPLPKIVLVRMALNIVVNNLLGAIPAFGDLFSVWFKSNVRNVELLERHASSGGHASTRSDWTFVLGLLLGVILLIGGVAAAVIWLIAKIWQSVQ